MNTYGRNPLVQCYQEGMHVIIVSRKPWKWIGYVLRRDPRNSAKTPEGKRQRCRAKAT